MNWTQNDVTNFVGYIRKLGGSVVKVLELMSGYEFSIRPPTNASPGWGKERMEEFDKQR